MKTPSLTFSNFLSPLECRDVNVIQTIEHKLANCATAIEKHYNVKIKSITSPTVSNDYDRTCDSEIYYNYKFTINEDGTKKYIGYKWWKFNEFDFTGYIALSQYTDSLQVSEHEIHGGELVFENYGTTIKPVLGNLIVYPASSNFFHSHKEIKNGDLTYIKVFFVCEIPFVYNFKHFGNKPFTSFVNC